MKSSTLHVVLRLRWDHEGAVAAAAADWLAGYRRPSGEPSRRWGRPPPTWHLPRRAWLRGVGSWSLAPKVRPGSVGADAIASIQRAAGLALESFVRRALRGCLGCSSAECADCGIPF